MNRSEEEITAQEAEAEDRIRKSRTLSKTEKRQLVMSRLGQGLFRRNVERVERRCRITQVTGSEHLRAGHIKPWRDSTNRERLDGNNGLLLAPHIDHLFDRGYISFNDNGHLLVSDSLSQETTHKWHIRRNMKVGAFNKGQQGYLKYHRRYVFKG